ncbi:hypothetical protein BKA83DRAFT_4232033 [Pisolithus microcarpus]|nr:hypothetical protein BKA83DRAFT_4232033 [Pisolithus microcarpus]
MVRLNCRGRGRWTCGLMVSLKAPLLSHGVCSTAQKNAGWAGVGIWFSTVVPRDIPRPINASRPPQVTNKRRKR